MVDSAPNPPLVPQPHGGALYRGGRKGNRGNRMRAVVQKQAMHFVAERLPLLAHAADGVVVEFGEKGELKLASPTQGERNAAMKLLWEIANSQRKISLTEVRKRLVAQVAAIRETLPPEQADLVLAKLAEVWK
ncbi:MAG TPA: hypothetical protein DGD08_08570 [Gemmatimonas aurantiaca]|uniref:Uncharacterized protein n=3 Tax=Gemmatimonas aurantiaca TaxID=173480 RepID=C1A438_GEMAT|nr:hypothetical protein GAU_1821 [Gemmatimonas aurantiaca T-27]HCT57252.1 hypothetical protein [Gemmatimonas aurantiaca]